VNELDRTIHEPVRLRIMALLCGVETADFTFLLSTLGLTKGNLASHMARLERDGLASVRKSFRGRTPHTQYRATPRGRQALAAYWREMDEIRALSAERKPRPSGS